MKNSRGGSKQGKQGTLFDDATATKRPQQRLPLSGLRDEPITSCSGCVFRPACGGLDQNAAWGCFTTCFSTCDKDKCDYVCPNRPRQFLNHVKEVGGLDKADYDQMTVPTVTALPEYVPLIQSGSCRAQPFDFPMVSLLLRKVIKLCKDGRYGPVLPGPDALRERFHLSPNTPILITSIATDRHLERYWRYARLHRTAEQIAGLDPVGMTVPNFSYFTDAPRTEILFNRRRGMIVADQLSAAGVGVVPHVNALTSGDWNFWERLLRDQPHIRFISKEFQTGLANRDLGKTAIENLARLQDRIGRDLHPILVGAARYIPEATRLFHRYTILDSRPYMATVMRHRLTLTENGDHSWVASATAKGELLDDLLRANIAAYSRSMAFRMFKAGQTERPT